MCDLFPFQTAKNDLRGGLSSAKGLQKINSVFFPIKNQKKFNRTRCLQYNCTKNKILASAKTASTTKTALEPC